MEIEREFEASSWKSSLERLLDWKKRDLKMAFLDQELFWSKIFKVMGRFRTVDCGEKNGDLV